jgi:hypothetical protein
MKLEKVVVRVSGTLIVLAAAMGALGLVTHDHALKVVAACTFGLGAAVAWAPTLVLIGALIVGSLKGR